VISYIDQHPSEILTQIEAVVAEQDGVLAVFHWRTHARSWQAILVSEVFGRMFDSRPIGYREAARLVDQILTVVRSLPDSRLGEEYELVYEAIDSWLHTAPIEIAREIPAGPAVRASHAETAGLFHRANEARSRGEGAGWLDLFLRDRGLWWQTDDYSLGEGSLSRSVGGAKQIIFMFPALRLGLLAVGRAHGRPDPAGAFMRARYELVPRLERAHTAIGYERSPERLDRAARELEGPVPADVPDERVLSAAGQLLLNAGRLGEAEDRLRRAAASSMIRDEDRASVLYNLSCVLARAGREGECRCALEGAIQLMPHLRTSLPADEDLASVRERPWFVALLPDDPARPPGRPEASSDRSSAEVRFDRPLVEAAPGDVPARFEGWEIRYAIAEVYDRDFPAWGRAIRAAFSVQFPGGTITVVSIPDPTESLEITPPEGTAPEMVAATTAVAHRVLAVLGRMAVTPARPGPASGGSE
jgi:hypothetical protein